MPPRSALQTLRVGLKLDSRIRGNDEWENGGDGKRASQRPAERLMQQRLLQFVQRGEFLLVEGFEALGFRS